MTRLPPPSGDARPGPPPAPDVAPLPAGKRRRGVAVWVALAIVIAFLGFGFNAMPLFAFVFGAPIDGLALLGVLGLGLLVTIVILGAGLPLAFLANRRRPWVRWPAILVCLLVLACWVLSWFRVLAIANPIL